MNSKLTFLSGHRPLSKMFRQDGSEPYPSVKSVTSTEAVVPVTFEGLKEKYEHIQRHAVHGNAMLKGFFSRPLNNESRAGKTEKLADTTNIILDFDNIDWPEFQPTGKIGAATVTELAEAFIKMLPEEFQNVSYIAHASSSFGRRPGKVGLHLDFFLKSPMAPKLLKNYLTHLNFATDFKDQMSLTASGTALKWPVDISLADNSRIVYIAPPTFEGVEDPMLSADDRTVLVRKEHVAVDAYEAAMDVDPGELTRLKARMVDNLRRRMGLSRHNPKTQSVRMNGQVVDVVTNPSACQMSYAADNDTFVYYNVNNGDSRAYYVRKANPQIVYNFKGEPNFLFEKADPETYEWHCKEFKYEAKEGESEPLTPMIFRDFRTDMHYNGLYNARTNSFEKLGPAQKTNLEAFMNQYGGVMPDTNEIPTWDIVFDPQDERVVDVKNGFINRFSLPMMLKEPEDIQDFYKYIPAKQIHKLDMLCPTVYKILDSLCGSDEEALAHFINWLAFILQERKKTGTAWVFHGTQGTGKGLLYHRILTPMLTHAYTHMKRLENVEDQFNAWLEQSLIVCIDEFKVKDSAQSGKLMNKLKNIITEPHGTIRAMRTEQREVPSFTNVIVFSNEHDSVSIPIDDRRFNVAPRQELPLLNRHPHLKEAIEAKLEDEIPLFASFLMYLSVDKTSVAIPLENDAKDTLRENTLTSVQEFVLAFRRGDLEYFIAALELKPILSRNEYLLAAQNLIKAWLGEFENGEPVQVSAEELRTVYNAMVAQCESTRKFTKLMRHHGLETALFRKGKVVSKGYETKFYVHDNPRNLLRTEYIHNNTAMEMPEFSQEKH